MPSREEIEAATEVLKDLQFKTSDKPRPYPELVAESMLKAAEQARKDRLDEEDERVAPEEAVQSADQVFEERSSEAGKEAVWADSPGLHIIREVAPLIRAEERAYIEPAIRADERETALSRAAALINMIDWDRSLPELVYSEEQEEAFRKAKEAAIEAVESVKHE